MDGWKYDAVPEEDDEEENAKTSMDIDEVQQSVEDTVNLTISSEPSEKESSNFEQKLDKDEIKHKILTLTEKKLILR
eukprot:gene15140-6327_t